jgi:hypothetical protein
MFAGACRARQPAQTPMDIVMAFGSDDPRMIWGMEHDHSHD